MVDDERGPHRYGALDEAGKELVSLLSTYEATVCNTWFEKVIHKLPEVLAFSLQPVSH